MTILLFQYLAINSKEICPFALEVFQIRHNIFPKYKIDPLNSPKSFKFLPKGRNFVKSDHTAELVGPILE